MVEHHPLAGSQAFAGLLGAASCLHVVPDYLLAMDRSLAPCWRLSPSGSVRSVRRPNNNKAPGQH